MHILHLAKALILHTFYAWAEREINPTHPDVPFIILQRAHHRRILS